MISLSMRETSYVNFSSFFLPGAMHLVWPPPTAAIAYEVRIEYVDASVVDCIGTGSHIYDSRYLVFVPGLGRSRFVRSRFVRNGNMNDVAIGGGLTLLPPPVRLQSAEPAEFISSEWIGNAAAMGPAIYVDIGVSDVRVTRCLFRDNVAYLSGGAINVQGAATSTFIVENAIFVAIAVRRRVMEDKRNVQPLY